MQSLLREIDDLPGSSSDNSTIEDQVDAGFQLSLIPQDGTCSLRDLRHDASEHEKQLHKPPITSTKELIERAVSESPFGGFSKSDFQPGDGITREWEPSEILRLEHNIRDLDDGMGGRKA